MRHAIKNVATETVFESDDLLETLRWAVECGRRGDYYADTGELMTTMVEGFRRMFAE